jgi:hypothetical protein
MFTHSHSGYKVEEGSMEEFLQAIQRQKEQAPQSSSRYQRLEQKLLESQAAKGYAHAFKS